VRRQLTTSSKRALAYLQKCAGLVGVNPLQIFRGDTILVFTLKVHDLRG
jgi:hypothetical protein